MQYFFRWTSLFAILLLAACGGGGGSSPAPALQRGDLLDEPALVATLDTAQIDAASQARGWQAASGTARCNVRLVALHYRTPGVRAEASSASGVLLLPGGACAGQAAPLLAYGRSTEVHKPRTLANPADPDTLLLAAVYAAHGYAVVATDYLGFAKSAHAFHPYLHAESEASVIVDAIRAARHAAARQGVALSGKVMLTGYSQGAHASMAAQRAIEQSHAGEIALAASAHLAGPYNLSGLVQRGDAIAGYQYFMPFLVTAWQKVYGDIYTDVHQAFKPPYASYIESLLPHATHTFTSLRTDGTLPGSEFTPAQTRDLLFQPDFINGPQTNTNHPLLVAARRNDLLAWAPMTRTLLCGGAADPTVSATLHQAAAKAEFDRRGATQVTSVDVDARIQAAYGTNGQAPTDPASPAYQFYVAAYHTDFVPPLCHAEARALFEQVK
jgi:dienelactone hydrolase